MMSATAILGSRPAPAPPSLSATFFSRQRLHRHVVRLLAVMLKSLCVHAHTLTDAENIDMELAMLATECRIACLHLSPSCTNAGERTLSSKCEYGIHSTRRWPSELQLDLETGRDERTTGRRGNCATSSSFPTRFATPQNSCVPEYRHLRRLSSHRSPLPILPPSSHPHTELRLRREPFDHLVLP